MDFNTIYLRLAPEEVVLRLTPEEAACVREALERLAENHHDEALARVADAVIEKL